VESRKRLLRGSQRRDEFKRKHKELRSDFWATDADLCLIDKFPPGTVAYLDYKYPGEPITFAEAIQYNQWICHAPVYIVEAREPSTGPFTIRRYLGADWKPEPPVVEWDMDVVVANDWGEFGQWEGYLRSAYRSKRNG
jgi:hypothetical protein